MEFLTHHKIQRYLIPLAFKGILQPFPRMKVDILWVDNPGGVHIEVKADVLEVIHMSLYVGF